MTLEVSHDEVNDNMVIKATGTVGYKEILALRDQLINHSNFRQNINQLFDCSQGKLNLNTDDLKRIAMDYTEVADQLGHNRKLALVVSRDLDFGMMRQYEAFFYSGPGVSICAFRSLTEAKEWLKSN